MPITEEDREGLADLIRWYRDKYHHGTSYHDELIEKVLHGTEQEFESLERVVDDWLDFRDY